MENRADQFTVLEELEMAIQKDKSKPQIGQLSDLGLVELTRHRQGQSLSEIFTKRCPACSGTGTIIEEFNFAAPIQEGDRKQRNPRIKVNQKVARLKQHQNKNQNLLPDSKKEFNKNDKNNSKTKKSNKNINSLTQKREQNTKVNKKNQDGFLNWIFSFLPKLLPITGVSVLCIILIIVLFKVIKSIFLYEEKKEPEQEAEETTKNETPSTISEAVSLYIKHKLKG